MTDKIHVQVDGEKREATEEELTQILADQAAYASFKAEEESKAEARSSALAKLAALGLTEEEIAAL
jgi:hypothetical protein